jgi:hypothetical protein
MNYGHLLPLLWRLVCSQLAAATQLILVQVFPDVFLCMALTIVCCGKAFVPEKTAVALLRSEWRMHVQLLVS